MLTQHENLQALGMGSYQCGSHPSLFFKLLFYNINGIIHYSEKSKNNLKYILKIMGIKRWLSIDSFQN